MKNLFDFATKELSQDAFLRWVLCHCEDKDLSKLSCDFIGFLTGNCLVLQRDDISRVVARPQVEDLDIIIQIYTKDSKSYLIAIEDKTDSKEHNQLKRYNQVIAQRYPLVNCVFRCYYKTEAISKAERDRVIQASWTIVEYSDIVNFWKQHVYHDNLIVRQYSQSLVAKQIVSNELKKMLSEYKQSQSAVVSSIKYSGKYAYIFLNTFKSNLMQTDNWEANRMWLAVCLEEYQGLLWVYCGFKDGRRCLATPGTFTDSSWWKEKYATLEDDIGTVSDVLTEHGKEEILSNLIRSVNTIIDA
ncbi:MAG: hypothetical protein IJS52_10575 [Bacilli bacterium]|nr:hypothetical protein [Bacilli bacterium]